VTARTGDAGQRLSVDFIACEGRGLCAEALPELITPDDWGFPIVSHQAVPFRLLDDARETVRACPKLALRLGHGAAPRPDPGRRGSLTRFARQLVPSESDQRPCRDQQR
jgi:ferredoxin